MMDKCKKNSPLALPQSSGDKQRLDRAFSVAYLLLALDLLVNPRKEGNTVQLVESSWVPSVLLSVCSLTEIGLIGACPVLLRKRYILPQVFRICFQICRLSVLCINPLLLMISTREAGNCETFSMSIYIVLVLQSIVYIRNQSLALSYMTAWKVIELACDQTVGTEAFETLLPRLIIRAGPTIFLSWVIYSTVRPMFQPKYENSSGCEQRKKSRTAQTEPCIVPNIPHELQSVSPLVEEAKAPNATSSSQPEGGYQCDVYAKFFHVIPHAACVWSLEINSRSTAPVLLNSLAEELLRSHPGMVEEVKLENAQKTLGELMDELGRNLGSQSTIVDRIRFKAKRREESDLLYDTIVFTFDDKQENKHVALIFSKTPKEREKENEILAHFKTSLISALTHELFTPINQLIPALQEMPCCVDPTSGTDLKEEALASAELLYSKIRDFVDYTKIELNDFVSENSEFDVEDLFGELRRIFQYEVLRKGTQLACKTQTREGERLLLYADKKRMKQVLVKLVSNAIKHCKNGTINVLAAESNDDLDVTFTVEDNGEGMNEGKVAQLFATLPEKARSLYEEKGRITKLPGIGLNIAQSICEQLGATLTVTSTANVGTICRLVLPISRIFHPPFNTAPSVLLLSDDEDGCLYPLPNCPPVPNEPLSLRIPSSCKPQIQGHTRHESTSQLTTQELLKDLPLQPLSQSLSLCQSQLRLSLPLDPSLEPEPEPDPEPELQRKLPEEEVKTRIKEEKGPTREEIPHPQAHRRARRRKTNSKPKLYPMMSFKRGDISRILKKPCSLFAVEKKACADPPSSSSSSLFRHLGPAPSFSEYVAWSNSTFGRRTSISPKKNAGRQSALYSPAASSGGIPASPSDAALSRDVVLVADDMAQNRLMITRMLYRMQIKTIEACDGKEALDEVTKSFSSTSNVTIRLILMDLSMPVMDGIESAREIRTLEKERNRIEEIPIVAVTAHTALSDKEACLDAGMQEVEAKPLSLPTLRRLIQTYCPTSI